MTFFHVRMHKKQIQGGEGGSFSFSAQLNCQEVSEIDTEDNLTCYFCKSVSDQKQQTSVKYTMFLGRNELILFSHQGYLCSIWITVTGGLIRSFPILVEKQLFTHRTIHIYLALKMRCPCICDQTEVIFFYLDHIVS